MDPVGGTVTMSPLICERVCELNPNEVRKWKKKQGSICIASSYPKRLNCVRFISLFIKCFKFDKNKEV